MSHIASSYRTGFFLALFGTALFALKSIIIKLAFQEGIETTVLLTLRMLIAFPFYLFIFLWLIRPQKKARLPNPKHALAIFSLGFFGYYLASYLDMKSLEYITAQLERLVLYTYPIMVAIMGWLFFGEKITRRIMLSLSLTYLGIVLLYYQEGLDGQGEVLTGVWLVFLSALSFSFYVVFSKNLIHQYGSLIFTCLAMMASTVYVLIHFFINHEIGDLNISISGWIYAFLLATISTLIPSFMISEAIHRIGSVKTGIVGGIGPMFTVGLAVVLLGEPFGWIHLAGMLLVILGVSALQFRKSN